MIEYDVLKPSMTKTGGFGCRELLPVKEWRRAWVVKRVLHSGRMTAESGRWRCRRSGGLGRMD
jgi:hypothetical protein